MNFGVVDSMITWFILVLLTLVIVLCSRDDD